LPLAGIAPPPEMSGADGTRVAASKASSQAAWANPATDGRMKHFQNSRVVEFERAGHWVHHDRLEDFLIEVRAFLAD
jgi:pimeloyl-ACP methyl ester carboxylesterase